MPIQRATFRAADLVMVEGDRYPLPGTTEPVGPGDFVELVSGGPELLVVAVDGCQVTAAWREMEGGPVEEVTLPRACWRAVQRISESKLA